MSLLYGRDYGDHIVRKVFKRAMRNHKYFIDTYGWYMDWWGRIRTPRIAIPKAYYDNKFLAETYMTKMGREYKIRKLFEHLSPGFGIKAPNYVVRHRRFNWGKKDFYRSMSFYIEIYPDLHLKPINLIFRWASMLVIAIALLYIIINLIILL